MQKSAFFAFSLAVLAIPWLAVGEITTLFSEDFESLPLAASVDEERFTAEAVWTDVPPAGWRDDDSGVPGIAEPPDNNGVFEWAGWNFADRDWWVSVAGDQRRSEFVNASGTVMIADGDEWDDADHPGGPPNGPWLSTFMSTPPISLEGVRAGSLTIDFDSSWRPEFDDNYHQTGNLTVSYAGGAAVEVMRWESDPDSPQFHAAAPNEHVTLELDNPSGASEAVFTFGYFDAGNDWWWAVDNISVAGDRTINPISPLSPISSIALTPDGVRITIPPPATNQVVGVQYSPDLSVGSWTDVGSFAEDEGIWKFIDNAPERLDRPRGYYRGFLRESERGP